MRIFQDLDDEDHHPDLSGSAEYSSGCDSSTEDLRIMKSSPPGLSRSTATSAGRGTEPVSSTKSTSSSSSGSRSPLPSPRTVRFDLGAALSDEQAAKKLTQTQVDLTTERTLRRRKEKTIVKLAKELNKRILEGEKKDKKIRELQQLLEEKESKLDSILSAASSLLDRGPALSSSSPTMTTAGSSTASGNSVALKRFLLEDALDQQVKKSRSVPRLDAMQQASSTRNRRYAMLLSMVLVSVAVGLAACTLDLGDFALPKLF